MIHRTIPETPTRFARLVNSNAYVISLIGRMPDILRPGDILLDNNGVPRRVLAAKHHGFNFEAVISNTIEPERNPSS